MKKIVLSFLTVLLLFIRGGAQLPTHFDIKPAEPTPTAKSSEERAQEDWVPVLKEMGVLPGQGLPVDDFNLMVRKLSTFPNIAKKLQESAGRIIDLPEWIRILKGMGIEPKPQMKDEEWTAILTKAGISLGGSVSGTESTPVPVLQQSPPVPSATKSEEKPVATQEKPITLDLKGMDILEVLKILSRQSGLNIVTSPNVRGNVTIYLKDVGLWDALRLVLETNDLAYVQDGNIVRVMQSADYERHYGTRFDDKSIIEIINLKHVKAAAMSRFLESVRSRLGRIITYELDNSLIVMDTRESLEKLKSLAQSLDQLQETKVFAVNYAKVEDIQAKLTPVSTKEIGELYMDKRTSRIMVTDSSDKIQQMEKILEAFDGQHRSVLIEAKIVQVTLSDKFQMGVNWERVFSKIDGDKIPGNIKGNFNNLPSNSLGLTATLGTLALNDYTGLIQVLETVGKTNLLSSPRITALNNEAAKILVGTKEAYVTTSVTTPGTGPAVESETVTFLDVGIKLFVTPIIGEDGFITMKIRPEVSSVDRVITTAKGNTIPILRTSEADTSVLVKNGETIMIAGLIEDRVDKTHSGIPWLARIPILGFPFRSFSKTKVKTEIVVFLTPKIIRGEENIVPVEKPDSKEKNKG